MVTLNRRSALNALTMDMIKDVDTFYVDCMEDHHIYGIVLQSSTKGVFSTGGDLRQIHRLITSSPDEGVAYFAAEYQHNWTLERFNKPNIALLNGTVMGGGVGFSQYGTHRIAGEDYSFSMPETRIGFFPDIGSAHVLSRLPAHIGIFLGLTGYSLNAADAYDLKLVSHYIPSIHYDEIKAAMVESDPIDPILEGLNQDPGPSELAKVRPWIINAFSAPTVEEIIARLENMPPDAKEWGGETAQLLRQRPPSALKVTLRHIREAEGDETIKDTLIRDYRLAYRFIERGDFAEGIRALMIDKDNNPSWDPRDLENISDADVDAYFAPLGDKELSLIDHGEII